MTAQEKEQLLQIAKMGALMALKEVGYKPKDEISQTQAYKEYGRSVINRWARTRRIEPKQYGQTKNSKIRYSRLELELLKKSEESI